MRTLSQSVMWPQVADIRRSSRATSSVTHNPSLQCQEGRQKGPKRHRLWSKIDLHQHTDLATPYCNPGTCDQKGQPFGSTHGPRINIIFLNSVSSFLLSAKIHNQNKICISSLALNILAEPSLFSSLHCSTCSSCVAFKAFTFVLFISTQPLLSGDSGLSLNITSLQYPSLPNSHSEGSSSDIFSVPLTYLTFFVEHNHVLLENRNTW